MQLVLHAHKNKNWFQLVRLHMLQCYLQWHHICSRLIWVKCTFHWCTDCGKYSSLICRGRKLLGWLSYLINTLY